MGVSCRYRSIVTEHHNSAFLPVVAFYSGFHLLQREASLMVAGVKTILTCGCKDKHLWVVVVDYAGLVNYRL